MKNIKNLESKKWSGGITKEIYRDNEDYNIRISCAKIDSGESRFSDFTGYTRILKILEGMAIITRDSKEITLTSKDTFFFGGEEYIISKNEYDVLDFNVIYKKEILDVEIKDLVDEKVFILGGKSLILFTEKKGIIIFDGASKEMSKYDFLVTDAKEIELKGKGIFVNFKERERNNFL